MRQPHDCYALGLGPFGAELAGYGMCDHGVRENEPLFSVPWDVGPDLVGDVEPENDNGRPSCRDR